MTEQDVSRLMHGITEHQAGDGARARRGDLIFHRRVPADLGNADQAEERQQQLVQCCHLAVREYGGTVRVDADGKVVGHQAQHVSRQVRTTRRGR